MPVGRGSPWGRVLRQGVALLGLCITFVVSLLAGLVLHLDMAVTRRSVRRLVDVILAETLTGQLALGEIQRLSPSEIRIASFRAATAEGQEVLLVEDVRMRGDWMLHALGVVLAGDGMVVLPHLRLEHARLVLEFAPDGTLSLARAFTPKIEIPKPEEPPTPPEPSNIGVELSTIELGQVDLVGSLGEGLPLDATVSRLGGRLAAGRGIVSTDIGRSSVRDRKLLGAETAGTLDFHLRGGIARELSVWGSFGGHIGELELHAQARYDKGHVDAELELPRVGSRELAPWLPGRPLEQPVSARARISGLAPLLGIEGAVQLPGLANRPAGTLSMQGTMNVAQPPLIEVVVRAERVDARLFGSELPSTEINAQALVRGKLAAGESELFAYVNGGESRIADETVPALSGVVAMAQAGIEAWLTIEEQGSPADVHLSIDKGIQFAVNARADKLAEVPRLRRYLGADAPASGSALVVAQGRLHDDHLDMIADARVNGARGAGMSVGDGHIHARVHGPRDALQLEARATGAGLSGGGQRIERFSMTANGPVARPLVNAELVDDQERTIRAKATLEPKEKLARQVELAVEKGGASLSGTVAVVGAENGALRVEGIQLSGLDGARLDGGLRVERGELIGKLKGSDVDLGPLSKLLGLPYRLRGKANVDVDLARSREGGREGHVRVDITDMGMLVVSGVNLSVNATFDGNRVEPRATLSLKGEPSLKGERSAKPDACGGTIAEFAIEEGGGELAGPLLDPKSWRRITGRSKLVARGIKLHCLAEIVDTFDPTEALPLEHVDGELDASVEIARSEPDAWPSLPSVTLRSRNLVLVRRSDKMATERLDVSMRGSFDAKTQELELDARLLDERAPGALPGSQLARFHGKATLDLPALWSDDKRRAQEALKQTPMSLSLESERRPLSAWQALPKPVRSLVAGAEGDVDIDLYAEGTMRDPSLALRVRAWDLRPASKAGRRWAFPIDVDVMGNLVHGDGRFDASVRRGKEVIASIDGTVRGDVGARITGERTDKPWTGSLAAKVQHLPLAAVPPLAQKRVTGEVNGRLSIDGLGDKPSVNANLEVRDLAVGRRLQLERTHLVVRPVEGEPGVVTVVGEMTERCPRRPCGFARATAYATLAWEAGLFPHPDESQPAAVYLTTRSFPISVVQPLVTPTVSRLDGRLTGAARLAYREIAGRDVALDIDMRIEKGVVHVPALGQEFYDVSGHVRALPGIVRIEDMRARAAGGAVNGKLVARFDGLQFKDLIADLSIDQKDPMPLRIQGAPLGTASVDKMVVTARNEPDAITIAPVIHGLALEVPVTNDVQELKDHPDIDISHAVGPPSLSANDGTGKPVHLTVHIAKSELRRGQLRIAFRTRPDAPIEYESDTGKMSGIIELTGGEVMLLGKVFRIESGHVRFRPEDPTNPYVSVTARWESPDGPAVFIDYIGPLKPIDRNKIRFRSDPPLPEDNIVALLLFGDPNAAASDQGGRNLGSGIAAQQFNDVLGEIVPGLSTSFDSDEIDGQQKTSARVVYHISDRVSAQASFESATDAASQRTANDEATTRSTKLSIDWRFAPNWLLRGSIGVGDDPSSGLDVLWQYRY